MTNKYSITVCSGIEWNTMLGLLVRLKKENQMMPYFLIGTGAYLSLRAKDLLNMRWNDILDKASKAPGSKVKKI